MTVATYFNDNRTPEPVTITDGSRMIIRTLQRLAGFSLALAAAALWVTPGSELGSGVLLYKMILSLTAVVAGLGLMQASSRPAAPQIEIDTIRREVRLVRRRYKQEKIVLSRCAYADLSKVELDGPNVRLWDADTRLIAELAITDRDTRRSLLGGLRDAGKVA